jgi:uncharacterized protein YjdB
MGEITVNAGDPPVSATVAYKDAAGNPTEPFDVPEWESSDDSIATVEQTDDGMTATVTPVGSGDGAGGAAAVISVVAHDDDGEEVRAEGTITVRPGDIAIGEITFTAGAEAPPAPDQTLPGDLPVEE